MKSYRNSKQMIKMAGLLLTELSIRYINTIEKGPKPIKRQTSNHSIDKETIAIYPRNCGKGG